MIGRFLEEGMSGPGGCVAVGMHIFFLTVGHWSIFQRGMSAQRQHHALRAHSLFGTCGIRLLHQIGPNISNAMAQIVGISVGGSTLKIDQRSIFMRGLEVGRAPCAIFFPQKILFLGV